MIDDIVIDIKSLRTIGGYKAVLTEPWQIRIDRGSILGNPFKLTNETQRDAVCELYKSYFYRQLKVNKVFFEEVARICNIAITYGKLELYCWCYPKKCHGETIKEFLQILIKEVK